MLQRSLDRARARKAAGDAGFTLIELLIVIVILGILAAIVVFSVSGITDEGKKSACRADVESVTTAEEAWYAGAYTTAGEGKATTPSYTTNIADLVTVGLLHSAPSTKYYTISVTTSAGPPAKVVVSTDKDSTSGGTAGDCGQL